MLLGVVGMACEKQVIQVIEHHQPRI